MVRALPCWFVGGEPAVVLVLRCRPPLSVALISLLRWQNMESCIPASPWVVLGTKTMWRLSVHMSAGGRSAD